MPDTFSQQIESLQTIFKCLLPELKEIFTEPDKCVINPRQK
jgi:hypothetical protein